LQGIDWGLSGMRGGRVCMLVRSDCAVVFETVTDWDTVFQELPASDKSRLLSQLAAKVFSHAVGSG
jgi:hypothetical protein